MTSDGRERVFVNVFPRLPLLLKNVFKGVLLLTKKGNFVQNYKTCQSFSC